MFTGLVQDIGIIRAIDEIRGDLRFQIETNMHLDVVQLGASICCSGCCLTVVDKSENTFFVEISRESQNRTMLGSLRVMNRINLEPSLKVGDELGGHYVFGHVDSVTTIKDITKVGGSHRIDFALPSELAQYVVEKGSITIDGVSLTVNNVDESRFSVNIIPHTWDNTTLSDRCAGDSVNMEIDMLARYVEKMLRVRS